MFDFTKGIHRTESSMRIESAPTKIVDEHPDELDRVIMAIAKIVAPDDPEDWASCCYVTDESRIRDFCIDDKDIQELSKELGIEVSYNMLIVDVISKLA